jgi:ribonuclease HI
MKREDFELYVYRNGLENKSIKDIFDIMSVRTMEYMLKDLKKLERLKTDVDVVYIYTDGGATNNGKENSKAVYGVYIEGMEEVSGVWEVEGKCTNQIAELMGIRRALSIVEDFNMRGVVICTDSMYGIKCVTEWSKRWKSNDWRTAKKEEVKNKELIKEILEIYERNSDKVEFKHIKSHTKEPEEKDTLYYRMWYGNKRVDDMIKVCLERDN